MCDGGECVGGGSDDGAGFSNSESLNDILDSHRFRSRVKESAVSKFESHST
jgi:hypothetical protein